MKPEYTLKLRSKQDADKVIEGLMNSGFIISMKHDLASFSYEIEVYGQKPNPHVSMKAKWDTLDTSKITCGMKIDGILDSQVITTGKITVG